MAPRYHNPMICATIQRSTSQLLTAQLEPKLISGRYNCQRADHQRQHQEISSALAKCLFALQIQLSRISCKVLTPAAAIIAVLISNVIRRVTMHLVDIPALCLVGRGLRAQPEYGPSQSLQ